MKKRIWVNRIEEIKQWLSEGKSLQEIGEYYGVSKQRMYQVLTKYGLQTPVRERTNFLRDKPPKYYWLVKNIYAKVPAGEEREKIIHNLEVPDYCPCLGLKLNYDGTGKERYSREDDSPSIDRINSSLGYTLDNIHIISWRANRIKNDSTLEELEKITNYLKNMLQ